MIKLPNFSAVIFDLDGLVLDTESTYFAAWQEAATMMGHHCSDAFCRSLSGLQYADVEHRLRVMYGEDFNLQVFASLSAQCWRRIVKHRGIAVKPGVRQLLALLTHKQIPFALATNSPLVNARECLALAGLEGVFEILIAREQVQHGKPAPDIFFIAAQRLKYPIKQCLVLEDSYNGVLAAYRAGAHIIYIPSNPIETQAEPLATCRLNNLIALADLIETAIVTSN